MLLLENFFILFLDAAPWLMGGLVIAGLIHSFVPTSALARHMGQDNLMANIKAAIFGAPLPLCSCSVIPAAISLRRNGASRSSTVSFLVSTPETGVDSIAVSYALLGPFMAIVRPVAAVTSAVAAGLLAILLPEKEASEPLKAENSNSATSCCSSKTNDKKACNSHQKTVPEKAASSSCCNSKTNAQVNSCTSKQSAPEKKSSCCSSQTDNTVNSCSSKAEAPEQLSTSSCCSSVSMSENPKAGLKDRFFQGQKYAFVDIFNGMAGWLLVGLILAAMTLTWLPDDFLTRWGGGFIAMAVMALVGIPMYICATASTPIAAGLLIAGISPGAVLVFLLAGPATNMATIGVVNRELGPRAVIAYLAGVLSVAFIAGFITNWLVLSLEIDIQAQLAASQHLLPEWLMYLSAALLAIMIIRYARQQLRPDPMQSCCG